MEDCVVICSHNCSFSQDSSDSGSIPPTDSRLPPDGHEFPPEYNDLLNHEFKDDLMCRKFTSNKNITNESHRPFKIINTNRVITRHDEKSIKSVKAKIAMFQSNPSPSNINIQSSEDCSDSTLKFDSKTRSMTNVCSTSKRLPLDMEENKNIIQGRSQSLLEIPSSSLVESSNKNMSNKTFGSLSYTPYSESLGNRRRQTLSKMKGLVIPENEYNRNSSKMTLRASLTVPNASPSLLNQEQTQTSLAINQFSYMPSKVVQTPKQEELLTHEAQSTFFPHEEESCLNFRKRASIELTNHKNVIDCCRKSDGQFIFSKRVGKPASRSSSFTIAERKKSFENILENRSFSKEFDISKRFSLSCTSAFCKGTSKPSDIIFDVAPSSVSNNDLKNDVTIKSDNTNKKTRPGALKCRQQFSRKEQSNIPWELNKESNEFAQQNDSMTSDDIVNDSLIKLGEEASSNMDVLYSSQNEKEISASLYEAGSRTAAVTTVFKSTILPDRKFSVPIYSCNEAIKMRDKKNNSVPSRPSSLVDTAEMKVFEIGNLSSGVGKDRVPISSSRITVNTPSNRRAVSVNDIRRAFEKAEASLSGAPGSSSLGIPSHNRMSSMDSTTSEESSIPTPHYYGSISSLVSGQTNLKDHYGSITSLASSTSLISPQELQGLIDEANQSLEESGTPSHEIMVIVLHREFTAGSIGITLAGGVDYENKDITVHKVIPGTLADKDGRIQKGDRVLSINGRSTKGVTHREALSILKAPRAEVVLVLSRTRSVTPAEYDRSDFSSYGRPPKILESPLDHKSLLSDLRFVDVPRSEPITVHLKKEGTGLGFSLEGGKDSPVGDRPLTIKKVFTGGAAAKTSVLKIGDEIISVNNMDCTKMSRIEAWNFMKKLSDGIATIVVRQKLDNSECHSSLTEKTNLNIVPVSSASDDSHLKIEANR